jgi:5,10-methylenetetrahydromethanopterin reductase
MDSHIGITLRDLSWEDTLDLAVEADRLGVDSLWVPESITRRDAPLVLAALAARTRHALLATGVANVYTRHPIQALMQAATLDEISGGRHILGLGSGNVPRLREFNTPNTERPLAQMREFVEVLRQGMTQPESSYHGQIFNFDKIALRSRREDMRVPIYFAAHNPGMLRLVGTHADGVLLSAVSRRELPQAIQHIRDGEAAAGRPGAVTIAAFIPTFLTPDVPGALAAAKVILTSFFSSGFVRQRIQKLNPEYHATAEAIVQAYQEGGLPAATALLSDEVVYHHCLIGDGEQVIEQLSQFRAAGIQQPILSIYPVPLKLKQFFAPLVESGVPEATRAVLSHVARMH